jgi:predicted dehydrogenase
VSEGAGAAGGGPARLAVVGAGAIAQLTHLPLLSKMRGARLVALCDNDGPKARALADRFDIPTSSPTSRSSSTRTSWTAWSSRPRTTCTSRTR